MDKPEAAEFVTLLLCKCGWYGDVEDQDALGTECGCCPHCGNEDLVLASQAAKAIERQARELEVLRDYKRMADCAGFAEGGIHAVGEELIKRDQQLTAANSELAAAQAELERLRGICQRESKVLYEALKRKNNKSMIKVVAGTLADQKGGE
jgi:hypothetical protein